MAVSQNLAFLEYLLLSPQFGSLSSNENSRSSSPFSIPDIFETNWLQTESLDSTSYTKGVINIGVLPSYPLDYARTIESYDFCINGIEKELNEYDIYQINLRSKYSERDNATAKPPSKISGQENSWFKPQYLTCRFCQNNGEPLSVYRNHSQKDKHGRVTCLKLRHYTCPICGSSGDKAHTIKHCPYAK